MPTTDAGLELLPGTENANEGKVEAAAMRYSRQGSPGFTGRLCVFQSSDRGLFSCISDFPPN